MTCALESAGDVYCFGEFEQRDDPSQVMDRCEHVFGPTYKIGYQRSIRRCSALPILVKPEKKIARLLESTIYALATDSTLVPLIGPVEPVWGDGFRFVDVSVDWHRCGIQATQRGYCWNANSQGELGNGTIQSLGPWSPTPTEIVGDRRWSVLKASPHYSTCGLTTGGEAFCWGYDLKFRLGVATTGSGYEKIASPARVRTDARFTALATTGQSTCALSTDRLTYCWGERSIAMSASEEVVPRVVSVPTLKALFGTRVIWGVDDAGNVHALEREEFAPTFEGLFSFAAVPLPFSVKLVAPQHAGSGASCAISASDDKLYCWGAGRYGSLGNGTFSDASASAPVAVVGQSP